MRILLTGAFGNVGRYVVLEMCKQGHELTCFDLQSKATEKIAKDLQAAAQKEGYPVFKVIWGNLTDEANVKAVLQEVQPEAIAHLAAIIPPVCYERPELAEKVNVGGVSIILAAAAELDHPPRIVFSSSYSIYGPHNPNKDTPLLTPEDPINPLDNYAIHKARAEKLMHNYAGEWVILRFGAIYPGKLLEASSGPRTFEFSFTHPPNQHRHGAHPADVALAVANACSFENISGRTFLIAGDESWQKSPKFFTDFIGSALGYGTLNVNAFYPGDPENDQCWYFESYMDTTESQAVLQFQKHTLEDYIADIRSQTRFIRPVMWAFAPLARYGMVKNSPFLNRPTPKADSYMDILLNLFPKAATVSLEESAPKSSTQDTETSS